MQLAALFLLLYSITLTLAPAARLHSWQVDYRWNHWIGFAVWLIAATVAHRQIMRRLPDRDPYLFPVTALLAGWGLLTIWRLDYVMGARQTIWLAISMAIIVIGLRIGNFLTFLRRYKYVWLVSGLLLTALTFLFGTYPGGNGPHLWLGCCGVYLMPSEPLKLLLIAYMAAYLADHLPDSFGLMQLLTPTLILVGAALILLVGQRDLGTTFLFILIYTVIVFIASHKKRTLLIGALILLAAGLAGYLLFDVVRIRIDAWINPWLDPAGRSYQIVQSIIAVASGQFLGRGPGLGSPGVVPVSHSDFIFSAIAEETGVAGAVGMLALYALLVGRGFRIAFYSINYYRRYLAAGITTYLTIQAIFIIGGNLRLLPLTGVTLPFVSYGGSSLLTAFIALLILILVSGREEIPPAPLANPHSYLLISGGLLSGLIALAALSGWWGVVRSSALQARPENPRRIITDRFVPRGSLLDRNNKPINSTAGQPGSYTREYDYPALSDTAGYNSPSYGQAGLEAGLDDYLRGLKGNPASLIWLDNLLYGQPPPGLDVRLTINLDVQRQADTLLQGHQGSLVLLNASTGEILAIASHPYFDPSQLDQTWEELTQDTSAPLLNRATQGLYPPGAALGPFLLAEASQNHQTGAIPSLLTYTDASGMFSCAINPGQPSSLGKSIANGCPGPLVVLGQRLGKDTLLQLYTRLGFYDQPELPLEVASPSTPEITQVELAAIGQENLTVTPLQMALAAAALTTGGNRPGPILASSVLTPDQGWQPVQHSSSVDTQLAGGIPGTLEALAVENEPYWQTVALAHSSSSSLTWYIAGTLPSWQGSPLALALVLEEPNPDLALQIGQSLFSDLLK